MNHKDSNESSRKKIESKNVKKAIAWLLEATKRTFKGHTKSTWVWITFFIIIFIISVVILFLQYQDDTWLFDKVVRWFLIPIIELEAWGWLFFLIFMGIQGILVPIPSELVLLSSGLVWGLEGGSILGIIGSLIAGVLTYYIAVLGGRPMMERFLGQENLDVLDFYIEKYGAVTILIARAFPFMAFDPISYASGFLKIKFRTYFIATLIGSIIRCVFYAWLGSTLYEGNPRDLINDPKAVQSFIDVGSARFNLMLIIIVIVLGFAYLFYQFLLMPYLKKKRFEEKNLNSPL
ncbi:MAG: VTT domain-containing protein [Candidatus Heimdallarchaeota archaeon]|nr:MAG: VTT domain-containing protein [Candidatus Heimdallarchaeota archaeon]